MFNLEHGNGVAKDIGLRRNRCLVNVTTSDSEDWETEVCKLTEKMAFQVR